MDATPTAASSNGDGALAGQVGHSDGEGRAASGWRSPSDSPLKELQSTSGTICSEDPVAFDACRVCTHYLHARFGGCLYSRADLPVSSKDSLAARMKLARTLHVRCRQTVQPRVGSNLAIWSSPRGFSDVRNKLHKLLVRAQFFLARGRVHRRQIGEVGRAHTLGACAHPLVLLASSQFGRSTNRIYAGALTPYSLELVICELSRTCHIHIPGAQRVRCARARGPGLRWLSAAE